MSKTIQEAEATIEELLEQRRQYEEWLAKLDASGDKAPPAVRQRVRGDYEARLQTVMQQLHSRGAAISEETLIVDGASCTTTQRPVRRTDSYTGPRSSGEIERRSMTSSERPSSSAAVAASRQVRTIGP